MVEASAARLASPSGYRGGFYNRCMHWRTFHHPQNAAGPLTRWVLAAWLCVLLTSVAAPFARATPPARQQRLSWGGAILAAPQWASVVSRVLVRLLPPVRAPPFETLKTIAASA